MYAVILPTPNPISKQSLLLGFGPQGQHTWPNAPINCKTCLCVYKNYPTPTSRGALPQALPAAPHTTQRPQKPSQISKKACTGPQSAIAAPQGRSHARGSQSSATRQIQPKLPAAVGEGAVATCTCSTPLFVHTKTPYPSQNKPHNPHLQATGPFFEKQQLGGLSILAHETTKNLLYTQKLLKAANWHEHKWLILVHTTRAHRR